MHLAPDAYVKNGLIRRQFKEPFNHERNFLFSTIVSRTIGKHIKKHNCDSRTFIATKLAKLVKKL